jgi:hypothetical protein
MIALTMRIRPRQRFRAHATIDAVLATIMLLCGALGFLTCWIATGPQDWRGGCVRGTDRVDVCGRTR